MIHGFNDKTNRKVRFFISSTFDDMNSERDAIVNYVFPTLRKEFQHRAIDIVDIDLRWGITEKSIEEGRLLEICLAEVRNCRPFFAGILGHRYGTVVDTSIINNLPDEIKEEIGNQKLDEVSITELEIRMGVIVPNTKIYSSFHIRHGKLPVEKKQKRLIDMVCCFRTVQPQTYTNISKFSSQIYRIIKSYIEELYPETPIMPFGDSNYYLHLNLLKEHINSYFPNNDLISKILRSIADKRLVYIYGEKGSGKSALISYLAKIVGEDWNKNVFFHFSDCRNSNRSLNNLYNRILLYIEKDKDFSLENSQLDLEIQLKQFVLDGKIKKDIYIFVDAVDKIESRINVFAKLYEFAFSSPHIHIVCSGYGGDYFSNYYENINEHMISFQIDNLNKEQINHIASNSLLLFGKELDSKYLSMVCDNKLCCNPLFLNLLICELRVFGRHNLFENYFNQLMQIKNPQEMLAFTIKRIITYYTEAGLDQECVYVILSLIAFSYNGLTENEIIEITEYKPIQWSPIYCALRYYFSENNGRIIFSHDIIRYEIQSFLSLTEDHKKDYCSIIRKIMIKYYSSKEMNLRSSEELAYQYYMSKNPFKLVEIITYPKCFLHLFKTNRDILITYFSILCNYKGKIKNSILKYCNEYISENAIINVCEVLCSAGCYSVCIDVAEQVILNVEDIHIVVLLKNCQARSYYKLGTNKYKKAIAIYEQLISICQSHYPDDYISLCEYVFKLAITYKSRGDLIFAVDLYKQAVEFYEKNNIEDYNSSWAIGNLASCYYQLGMYKDSVQLFEKAIRIRKRLYGTKSAELAWEYCYYWPILYAKGDLIAASELTKITNEIYASIYKKTGGEYAWSCLNNGIMLAASNQYLAALNLFEKSIELNDMVLNKKSRPHVFSLTAMNNIAVVSNLENNMTSEQSMRTILELKQKKLGKKHPYTANSMVNLALLTNTFNEAIILIDTALKVFKTIYPNDYKYVLLCKIYLLIKGNKKDEAFELLTSCNSRNGDITDYIQDKLLYYFRKINDDSESIYKNFCLYLTRNNISELLIIPKIDNLK